MFTGLVQAMGQLQRCSGGLELHIPSGAGLDPACLALGDNGRKLVEHAKRAWDRALALGGKSISDYRELWRKVSVMSMHLRTRFGLARGDRVAFAMTNCPESIEVMYAIWHAGLCAVPMNAKLHAKEFAFILANSGAKLCFVTPDLLATIGEAAKEAPELKEIVDTTTRSFTFMAVGDPAMMVDCEPTDPAWLFYTSGTTGRPKGAVLSHRNLLTMALNYYADVDRAYRSQFPGKAEGESEDQVQLRRLEILRSLIDNELMIKKFPEFIDELVKLMQPPISLSL